MLRFALVVLVLLSLGCGASSRCGPSSALVQEVTDGDTVTLSTGQKVRYLSVDTPETTKGKHDCYGAEAAAYNTERVLGKTVQLTYDETACEDRFGRLLAYVTVDGSEVNTELISKGLACALYVAPGGAARKDEFDTAESVAKTERTGMWGVCTSVPCDE